VAEAIYSGTTTVNDECHNVPTHEYAEQDIRALQELGIRGEWSYGPYREMSQADTRIWPTLNNLHKDSSKISPDGLLTLAYTWGSIPGRDSPPPDRVATKEIKTARGLGTRVTMHLASRENTPGRQVQALGDYLKNNMLLIHMLATTRAEMKLVAASGASISCSPGSELRIGYGLTKACAFMDAGINVAVSVQTAPLTENCYVPVLKLMRNAECAKAQNEFKLTARKALEIGTIHGARALGIEDKVGLLKPSKRADLS